MIGTVGSADKALRAKEAGAWDVINYQSEDIAARVKDITHGEKVNVVYDSVGQSTWLASLDSLKRRGLMVSFGNASVPGFGCEFRDFKPKRWVIRHSSITWGICHKPC